MTYKVSKIKNVQKKLVYWAKTKHIRPLVGKAKMCLRSIRNHKVDFISVDFERKIGKRQKSREKEKNL